MHPPPSSHADAERTAQFLLDRVRVGRGRLWDQGARVPLAAPGTPALEVFARRRVRGIPEVVAHGLLAWARGGRPADLVEHIPTAPQILRRQSEGRRYVSLIDDARARAHGDPRHPDGLAFVLHDLCHLEKFVAPAHHRGQIGFFRAVRGALANPEMIALERTFDDQWRADRDYVIADMNGSAIFLFALLKMRVNMAVRRRLAADRGRPAPTGGPLDEDERAALRPAVATLFRALALPPEIMPCAFAVSARHDSPEDARRLLAHFEAAGSWHARRDDADDHLPVPQVQHLP
jgi:hypothetical protein